MPHQGQITSTQILECNSEFYLIDCGEGAQIKLSEFGFRRTKINNIFISHLHGDHIFGLPGLITSFGHFSRKVPLRIIGPLGIKKYVQDVLRASFSHLSFDLIIDEYDPKISQEVFRDKNLRVQSFPLFHRIPTMGFRFTETKKLKNIKSEAIATYYLTIDQIKAAKRGEDIILADGNLIPNSSLTQKESQVRSYAYCSDTSYNEEIIQYIKDVDLLYHESTYLQDLAALALERGHSTAHEAAMIAKKSNSEMLLLGHFSNRYRNKNALLIEAQKQFKNTFLAEAGKTFEIVKK